MSEKSEMTYTVDWFERVGERRFKGPNGVFGNTALLCDPSEYPVGTKITVTIVRPPVAEIPTEEELLNAARGGSSGPKVAAADENLIEKARPLLAYLRKWHQCDYDLIREFATALGEKEGRP